MSQSTLIKSNTSRTVTRAELAEVPTPPATYSWRPIPHLEFVEAIETTLNNAGYTIDKTEVILARNDQRLFGTFDLSPTVTMLDSNATEGMSLGFRHSHDKSLPASLVAGAKVFVCDNLILTGQSVVLKHKHTWGWSLLKSLQFGMGDLLTAQENLRNGIYVMKDTPVNDDRAKAIILDASINGVMPKHMLSPVYEWFFEQGLEVVNAQQIYDTYPNVEMKYPDVAPRTLMGLHNAFTRAFKMGHAAMAFDATQKLGRLFNI